MGHLILGVGFACVCYFTHKFFGIFCYIASGHGNTGPRGIRFWGSRVLGHILNRLNNCGVAITLRKGVENGELTNCGGAYNIN